MATVPEPLASFSDLWEMRRALAVPIILIAQLMVWVCWWQEPWLPIIGVASVRSLVKDAWPVISSNNVWTYRGLQHADSTLLYISGVNLPSVVASAILDEDLLAQEFLHSPPQCQLWEHGDEYDEADEFASTEQCPADHFGLVPWAAREGPSDPGSDGVALLPRILSLFLSLCFPRLVFLFASLRSWHFSKWEVSLLVLRCIQGEMKRICRVRKWYESRNDVVHANSAEDGGVFSWPEDLPLPPMLARRKDTRKWRWYLITGELGQFVGQWSWGMLWLLMAKRLLGLVPFFLVDCYMYWKVFFHPCVRIAGFFSQIFFLAKASYNPNDRMWKKTYAVALYMCTISALLDEPYPRIDEAAHTTVASFLSAAFGIAAGVVDDSVNEHFADGGATGATFPDLPEIDTESSPPPLPRPKCSRQWPPPVFNESAFPEDHVFFVTAPDYLKCPITHQLMREPVLLCNPEAEHHACHTYEREAIERHMHGYKGTEPLTNLPLPRSAFLVVNDVARAAISSHLEKCGGDDGYWNLSPSLRQCEGSDAEGDRRKSEDDIGFHAGTMAVRAPCSRKQPPTAVRNRLRREERRATAGNSPVFAFSPSSTDSLPNPSTPRDFDFGVLPRGASGLMPVMFGQSSLECEGTTSAHCAPGVDELDDPNSDGGGDWTVVQRRRKRNSAS